MDNSFEREVLDRLTKIESKLDGFTRAKETTYNNERRIIVIENDLEDVEKEVKSLTESNKWLFRTVVAAIIAAVVGLVFAFLQTGAGI